MSENPEQRFKELSQENKVLREASSHWEQVQQLILNSNNQLKQLQQSLSDSYNKVMVAMEAGGISWWELDCSTGKIRFGEQFFRILGYQANESPIHEKDFFRLIHPDQVDEVKLMHRNYLEGKRSVNEMEYQIKTHGGDYTWFLDKGKIVDRDILGNPVKIAGILVDVDVRKKQEHGLKRSLVEAEAANRAKSLFLSNMSHEIYTPMAGVVGMAEILRQSKLSQEQLEYLDIVVNSASNLMSIFNDIMEFLKIEAGKIEISYVPFHVVQIFQEVVNQTYEKCQKKKLTLISFIDPNIPGFVLGDPVRLKEVLQIFASNAVKFTEEGEIYLESYFVDWDDDSIRIGFGIRDTGIGISNEDLGKLFQSFEKVSTSISGKYGGSGLGLAIAKHLIHMMRGEVEVESVWGEGSAFRFTIRFDRVVDQEVQLDAEPINGKKILLVDDNRSRREATKRYFVQWECEVEESDSMNDATEKVQTSLMIGRSFDLIVLESSVFGQAGIATSELLRHKPWLTAVKILLTDPEEDTGSVEKEKLFHGFLKRYYTPAQLLSITEQVISGKDVLSEIVARESQAGLSHSEKRALKILLAEDNLINQKVALVTLKKLGHHTDLAENGMKAVELSKQMSYDLILMDIHMPVMDGLEATRQIRKLEEQDRTHKPAYICAITANVQKDDEEQCYQAGMNCYITKPFRLDVLNDILSRI